MSTTVSISGSANVDVTVFGRGTVIAGNGNDSIKITGPGKIIVGSGHDTLTLSSGGIVYEHGASGHDTINIGAGNATIYEQGFATVTGAFGSATIHGGGLTIHQTGGSQSSAQGSGSHSTVSGSGTGHDTMVSGSGHESSVGSLGHESSIGKTDHTPRQGGMERNLFATLVNQIGDQHLVKSFLSGVPLFHVEGRSLSYMAPHNSISTHDGNTHISMGSGHVMIELQGVTTLKASELGKH